MQRYTGLTTLLILFIPLALYANTSIIVSAGASADGSVIVSYSHDDNNLGGFMFYSERSEKTPGTTELLTSNWEGKKVRSEVDVSGINYKVSGHMNEHQLVIGDSSFLPLLGDAVNFHENKVDTGILIEMTLRKASTAREAIFYIDELTEKLGFYGPGKSFSIADREEAWIMEMISKGPRGRGTVWVARKIPNGYISGHADSARITTFPLNDKENCLYSDDLIPFAEANGLWDGKDEDFSFADVYTKMSPMDIRQSEGRLWSIFRKINSATLDWKDYIMGDIKRSFPARGTANGIITNRLPLWVKADRQVEVRDVMDLMRDHYENSDLSMSRGIWAGPFAYPYRLRPDNATAREYFYNHDRPVSVQYTGYSFVSQSRKDVPPEIGGISWFGVDDTYMTVYLPVYSGASAVPSCFSREFNPIAEYHEDSAYWLFNMVSNLTSLRYKHMIIDIQKVQRDLEDKIHTLQREMDSAAREGREVSAYLTEQSEALGAIMMDRWRELFHYLLIKYKDGEVRTEKNGKFITENKGGNGLPTQVLEIYGYPADWAQAMIGKDNPPDLKAIYSDDELMDLFAKNNSNSTLVIILLGIIALLSAALIFLFIRNHAYVLQAKRRKTD